MLTKTCKGCGIDKPHSEFKIKPPGKGDRFGLNSRCKECERIANRAYHAKNAEKIAQRKIISNSDLYQRKRSEIIKRCSQYQIEHPEVGVASQAKRRAIKLHCLVSWTDEVAIKNVYENCPDGSHVDHIVPLQGKLVCGLHVPWNLQYLTGSENISKSNKWNPIEDSKRFDKEYGI